MTIADFRDIVIIISGIIELALLVTIFVVVLLIYNKIKPILSSIREITESIRKVTTYVASGVGNPIVQMISLFNGIREGIEMAAKAIRRKKEDKGDKKEGRNESAR